MKTNYSMCALTLTLMAIGGAQAQAPSDSTVPVTVENFVRAESDLYFGQVVNRGGFGKFYHLRELVSIDRQLVIRSNRDTLYSGAVFDLSAGPVTISLPNAGNRYMSMQVIDENHYTLKLSCTARAAIPSPGRMFLRVTSWSVCALL
jgi:hypothetical protein